MEENTTRFLRETIETEFRKHLTETFNDLQDNPEVVQVIMLMQACDDYKVKWNYANILKTMSYLSILYNEKEYTQLMESAADKILGEFIHSESF